MVLEPRSDGLQRSADGGRAKLDSQVALRIVFRSRGIGYYCLPYLISLMPAFVTISPLQSLKAGPSTYHSLARSSYQIW